MKYNQFLNVNNFFNNLSNIHNGVYSPLLINNLLNNKDYLYYIQYRCNIFTLIFRLLELRKKITIIPNNNKNE